jgi:hypothetical protein
MNWEPQFNLLGKPGSPGKTAGIGMEVGVLRKSEEAPVMGAEQRRDTCPSVRSDRGRWPRKGIRLYDYKVIYPDFSAGGKPWRRIGLGKPDTGNPSVRFDEGPESDGHWLVPFTPSAPAYSTPGFWLRQIRFRLFPLPTAKAVSNMRVRCSGDGRTPGAASRYAQGA